MASYKSIFISHSSKDKQNVRILANHLTEYGIKVWLDETELFLGDPLTEKISNAIESFDYILIILSFHSMQSSWVKRELEIALKREHKENRLIIIPILFEKVDMPEDIQDRLFADFTDQEAYHLGFHQLLKLLGYRFEFKGRLDIFSDSRKLGWENWSWNCDFDEKCTQYVRIGRQYSLCAKLGRFGGLALTFRSGINTRGYKKLEFYINGGDDGGQRLKIFVNDKLGNGIRKPVALEELVPKEWKLVNISLKDLDAEDIIIVKINISDVSGEHAPQFYLSDLSLV